MAQFYAIICGAKGPASRLGTARSGITTSTKSCAGQVNVSMHHNVLTGRDMVCVTLGEYGGGRSIVLYDGPASGWQEYLSAGELGRMAWWVEHTSLRLPTPVLYDMTTQMQDAQ
jgi:hypothetical protein